MGSEPNSNLQCSYLEVFTKEMHDPGSFTIPCKIGNSDMGKTLCDFGASINLMPLSVVKRLSLGELTPTAMTLQMADRT